MKFKVLKMCSFPFLNVCIMMQFEVNSYCYGVKSPVVTSMHLVEVVNGINVPNKQCLSYLNM